MQLSPTLDAMRGSRALHALGYPAFRRIWLAAVLDGFASQMERLAVGWFVLNETGSVFLAALSFAVRNAPNMVLGPFGGAVADRFDRARVLRTTSTTKAILLAAVGVVVLSGVTSAWPIFVLITLSGAARVSEVPAMQALIRDIVGPDRVANAIGLHALGVRTIGMMGAFAGGLLINLIGTGAVFLVAASALALAAATYWTLTTPRVRAAALAGRTLWSEAIEGLRVVLGIPVVLTVLLLAVGVEILAFSYQSLMPAVAERVLHVDAVGLGTLTLFTGLGGIAGTGVLSLAGDRMRRGSVLLAVTFAFGGFLIVFASSERFVISLAIVMGVGAMAAFFDALQWILLQSSVPDEMRGRVIGTWMSAIGFGWLGPITLGAIAEVAGTQWALAASGMLVVALAAGASMNRGLRRL
jgi:MFS family permease